MHREILRFAQNDNRTFSAACSVCGFPIDLGEDANLGLRLIVAAAGGLGIPSAPPRTEVRATKSFVLDALIRGAQYSSQELDQTQLVDPHGMFVRIDV